MVNGFDNIEQASLTDVGVRRSHNQDSLAVLLATDDGKWRERGHVLVVADGMGAHAVGELASDMAVNIIPHAYSKHAEQGAAAALRKAFIEANSSIHNRGQQNREFEGMGTTSTSLVLRPEGAWLGHVGDSRGYRIRQGYIEQLTFDHSLVWEFARRQGVDPDSVQGIPSNVIIRSLGPEPLVQVDVEGPHPLQPGDTFLVCSDGLSGQVSDHEMGAVASVLPADEACRFLVDLANLRGGPDNITVVIARIGKGNEAPVPVAAPRGWGWPTVLPWWLLLLITGVLCAAGAAAAAVQQNPFWGIPATIVAGGTIVAGLIGLGLHHRQERQKAEQEVEYPKPKIHRRSPCGVDRVLVDKLHRAILALRQQLADRGFQYDDALYQRQAGLGEGLVAKEDWRGAFREYCRAMRPLAEALQKHRNKEEVFQPVWDRNGH